MNRDFLSLKVLSGIDGFRDSFVSALPFKHLVLDGFFTNEVVEGLLADFPKPDPSTMINEHGQASKKHVVSCVSEISEFYAHLDKYIGSEAFIKVMEDLTGIKGLLYDPGYYGGGTHNNLAGQGMNPHVDFNLLDIPEVGQVHRRINAIIYLNEDWQEDWGGNLELHSNPWKPDTDDILTIVPKKNRLVLFETNEISWHGFKPVSDKIPEGVTRKSFAIYMYTKERPAEEVVPSHGTFYVPEFPEASELGLKTKAAEDKYRDAAERARTMVYNLYQKEKALNGNIDEIRRELDQMKELLRAPIGGGFRQVGPVKGFHADGTVSKNVSLRVMATTPVNEIRVQFYSIDFIDKQSVDVSINGEFMKTIELDPDQQRYSVPISLQDGDCINIDLKFAKSAIPRELGIAEDARNIAGNIILIEGMTTLPRGLLKRLFA